MNEIVLTGTLLFIAAIIGLVEFVKAIMDQNWRIAVIIFVAAVAGALLGGMDEIGLTALQGAVAGLGASGVIKSLKSIKD